MTDLTDSQILSLKAGDVVLVKLPRDAPVADWHAIGSAVKAQIESVGHLQTPVLCIADDCDVRAMSEADVIALLAKARAK